MSVKTVVYGEHANIIQSMLDYDYLLGSEPSIIAVLGSQKSFVRFFYGNKEILLPAFKNFSQAGQEITQACEQVLIAVSGRRVLSVVEDCLQNAKNLKVGSIFAESVPEQHALKIRKLVQEHGVFMVGPASAGYLEGGMFKLGAIGGTTPEQIKQSGVLKRGNIAVLSISGGMSNELINYVASQGSRVSFAAAIGGERFPALTPVQLVKKAQEDTSTEAIVYFGEVGGEDEYAIAEYRNSIENPKLMIAYIAGKSAEKMDSSIQFGHAKSMAMNQNQTASAKNAVLKESGVITPESFTEFMNEIAQRLPKMDNNGEDMNDQEPINDDRHQSMFASSISQDQGGDVKILGQPLVEYAQSRTLSAMITELYLGKTGVTEQTITCIDAVLKLLVEHGPQVSGAVNTMITARAGKDLPSALASGILTIGPRFGGAINDAAPVWLNAVENQVKPADLVESFAADRRYIPGIGHKKYRTDNPDPRVEQLLELCAESVGIYTQYAQSVAAITTKKKSNLILNVDGLIAGLVLDVLSKHEGYTTTQLESVIETGFFNALFITGRSIGFTAHYIDQKRLGEGLFRLPDDQISNF